LIDGNDGATFLTTFLFDPDVSKTTFSPSDFNWSTKESTSFDLPPSFIALELAVGFLNIKIMEMK
jgi:hypothetical protein